MVREQNIREHHHYCNNTIYSNSSHGVECGLVPRRRINISNKPCFRLFTLWCGSYRDCEYNQRWDDHIFFDKTEET